MINYPLENLANSFMALKTDLTLSAFSKFAEENNFTYEQIQAMDVLFEFLRKNKEASTIYTLQKMSRLPLKSPKTFDNFDFSIVKGKNCERLQELKSLATIHAHKNLAFIGPAGTGKTHLAQAFGFECCLHGLKTYFIKMSELRDKFIVARRAGNESNVLNNLVRPSCLIIDEVGHCDFDKENTRLFFDLIDRRYNKEGSFNMVFTSNKNPSLWTENFKDDGSLLCALDRVFDDATVFTLRGESFRGKNLETINLQTSRVKSDTSETPKN